MKNNPPPLDQAGHTYYEGPGVLEIPGSEKKPVAPEESLDITTVPDGAVVRGGTIRQVGPRSKWTHQLWLDEAESIILKRSRSGGLEPIDEHDVHRVR